MIRKYEETDMASVLDIWYRASTLAHPFLADDFVEKVKKDMRELYLPNSETWVYEEKGRVVGFISMLGNEIGGLFVMPNQHSKGTGTKLVDYIRGFHDELEVEVFKKNNIGRAFYDKYGFKLIKEFFHKESNAEIYRLSYK